MEKQSAEISINTARRRFAAVLIAAIASINGFAAFISDSDVNFVYYDLLRIGSIVPAVGLSIAVFLKQGRKGLFGKAYTGLLIGLTMWLAAESIWGYYEVVLGVERPFPSIADGFWLGGYGGLLYYVFSLYKFFGRGVKKYTIAGVTAAIAVFGFFYLDVLVSASLSPDDGEAIEEYVLPLAIFAAYPVLDAILLVPAILIVSNSGKGQLTSVPWIFVSFILVAIADILLGYGIVVGFEYDITITSMAYNASYLFMSVGLLWYLRFFISTHKQVFKD